MSSTWPEGVIARYPSVADPSITVDVTNDGRPDARCTGCSKTFIRDIPYVSMALVVAHRWAQDHAEKCRALPNPDGAR